MLVYAGTNDLGLTRTGTEVFAKNCDAIGARIELLDSLDHAQAFRRSDLVMPFVRDFLRKVS